MGSGGQSKTTRETKTVVVTMAKDGNVSAAIDLRLYGAAGIIMPAAWTTADLGIQVCATVDGTYVPLLDKDSGYGTDVSIDAADAAQAYALRWDAFAFPFVKLWSHDGAGANVAQAAARTFTVCLKS